MSYKIPSIKTTAALYKIFKKEKPDVVHTAGAEANFHGILAAKFAGIPVKIAEEIGIPNHSRIAKFIFSKIFSYSDYVIGESNIVVNHLKDHYNLKREKVIKVFNFILNPSIEYKPKIQDGKFKIVSISRLVKVKNIEAVLIILPELIKSHPNVIYTIVGDGPEEENLKKLVNDLNLGDFVEFAGFTSNPFEFLQQSDLFLLNSFTEGFSNSLLEAMYCGIPSLSTRVGGAEDMIEDGVNGWIIPSGSNHDLLNKLNYILTLDPDKQQKIGKVGQFTVKQNFTLTKHIEELLKLYEVN